MFWCIQQWKYDGRLDTSYSWRYVGAMRIRAALQKHGLHIRIHLSTLIRQYSLWDSWLSVHSLHWNCLPLTWHEQHEHGKKSMDHKLPCQNNPNKAIYLSWLLNTRSFNKYLIFFWFYLDCGTVDIMWHNRVPESSPPMSDIMVTVAIFFCPKLISSLI